jgi:MFS transporter, FHS family, glucose/mannose:H+ symporter
MLPTAITLNGFIGFTLIATLVAMFGPSFPALQTHFAVDKTQVGFSLTAHFIGTLIGTLSVAALSKFALRPKLLVCSSIFVLGSMMIAFAPSWSMLLAGAAFRGVGAGLYLTEISGLFVTGFGKRSAAMLGLVNAAYGAGSFLGPVLVGMFSDYQTAFLVGSGLSLILVVLALLSPNVETCRQETSSPMSMPYGLIALFMLLLFCSGGIENGLGAWMATHFVNQGMASQTAANYTGMYWAVETLGRILMTPLALRFHPFQLMLVGFALETVFLVLAYFSGLMIPTYILCGLSVAPLFTSGLAWMARAMPGLSIATTLGLTGALLGSAAIPPILGKLLETFSVNILPASLLVITLLGLSVAVILYFITKNTSKDW